ncbi:flavin reductase [Falcatimonas sp. MSJ-15]|uniref:flavin reductase n=1 Tax=Falcatimonas sp. MSJ-15 TaxID=2841515 RepID=UPI001C115FB7|nr:flavin reductase [Falcatimonas sp. MSJ-15]MBU5470393.1 flavin reductase [Falcatimonas sp. MSJ-15]
MQHSFQPIDTELLEFNPFTKIGKDWMLITAGDEKKANTMTASWGGVGVLWGKNVVYIFVRESRYTKEFIDNGDSFSLTFFDKNFSKSGLKYLGAVSGRDEDKIKNANMSVDYYDDVPYIDEGNVVFICKKLSETKIEKEQFIDSDIDEKWYKDGNYHTMYVGEITQILAR